MRRQLSSIRMVLGGCRTFKRIGWSGLYLVSLVWQLLVILFFTDCDCGRRLWNPCCVWRADIGTLNNLTRAQTFDFFYLKQVLLRGLLVINKG